MKILLCFICWTEHSPGIVQLKFLQGGNSSIGSCPFVYESNIHQRLNLISLFIGMLDRVCTITQSKEQMSEIDTALKQMIENEKSSVLDYLFSPYEDLSDSFGE